MSTLSHSMSAAIEVNSVCIDYKNARTTVRAVDHVSFSVNNAERFVIMGRSGCGKSSLLKAIGGFISPTAGAIFVHGKNVSAPGPDRMVIWQDLDQLLAWKTVEANVAYPLLLAGIEKKEAFQRATSWLARLGLEKSVKLYPHQLSGGMKQRVAIARGFVTQPAVLLMDEPFSALDALTRYQLQDELIALQEECKTSVIFISHDVSEAVRIGQRVLVLSPNPGRVKDILNGNDPQLELKLRELIWQTSHTKTNENMGFTDSNSEFR